MIIEDGHGTGRTVEVTDEGLFRTEAVIVAFPYHINKDFQEAYSIIVEKTPTAAGDCFFYIKNNSEDDMIGVDITLAVDTTAEIVQLWGGVQGTPVGVTANTPINLNLTSGKKADVTCYDGVDITGLVGGGKAFEFRIKPDESSQVYKTDAYVIIPKNGTFALYVAVGGINIHAMMTIVFHP